MTINSIIKNLFERLPQEDQNDLVEFSFSTPTLLTCAVANNNIKATRYLLSKKSDPSYQSCNGKSPLSYAIIRSGDF
jgi:ankyrin repeat protein